MGWEFRLYGRWSLLFLNLISKSSPRRRCGRCTDSLLFSEFDISDLETLLQSDLPHFIAVLYCHCDICPYRVCVIKRHTDCWYRLLPLLHPDRHSTHCFLRGIHVPFGCPLDLHSPRAQSVVFSGQCPISFWILLSVDIRGLKVPRSVFHSVFLFGFFDGLFLCRWMWSAPFCLRVI